MGSFDHEVNEASHQVAKGKPEPAMPRRNLELLTQHLLGPFVVGASQSAQIPSNTHQELQFDDRTLREIRKSSCKLGHLGVAGTSMVFGGTLLWLNFGTP